MPTPEWLETANLLYLIERLGVEELNHIPESTRAVTTVHGRKIYCHQRRFYQVEGRTAVFGDLEGAMLYALSLLPLAKADLDV